jgi:phosphatidylglycerophosphate synthase
MVPQPSERPLKGALSPENLRLTHRLYMALGCGGILLASLALMLSPLRILSLWFWLGAGVPYAMASVLLVPGVEAFHKFSRLGLANLVTLLRLVLTCLILGLATHCAVRHPSIPSAAAWLFFAMAFLALVLDGADGALARRQGLASAFGARFDMEVDALFILALSVMAWASGKAGAWVLLSGLLRYLFLFAGRIWPPLARPLLPTFRAKLICVIQAAALVALLAPIFVPPLSAVIAALALFLLLYSFAADALRAIGVDVKHRDWLDIVGALTVLHIVLILPNRLDGFTASSFIRIPLELPIIVVMLLASTGRLRLAIQILVVGALIAVVSLKGADIATYAAFDRPFNVSTDLPLIGAGIFLLKGAVGLVGTIGIVGLIIAAIAGLATMLFWSTNKICAISPRVTTRMLIAAAASMGGLTMLGWTDLGSAGRPAAAYGASALLSGHLRAAIAADIERIGLLAEAAEDPLAKIPDDRLLVGLKGTDVVLIFVESYGRSSLENAAYAATTSSDLSSFDTEISAAGFQARSAWLTSPTYGGQSWLAHSTFLSGLRIDSQARYDALVDSDRRTLVGDFHRAGWQGIAIIPLITRSWPQAKFFGYDAVYGAADLGYAGADFGYVTMPDQYALSASARKVLEPKVRPPVFAQIVLNSSHAPWTPLPPIVPWNAVGDGHAFDRDSQIGDPPNVVWRDDNRIRDQYRRAIDYDLNVLKGFFVTQRRDNMILIIVGDHQPASFVSGEVGGHDVPIHIVARDPKALATLDEWGWTDGMRPGPGSPVWPMEAMRERLIRSFSDMPPGPKALDRPVSPRY